MNEKQGIAVIIENRQGEFLLHLRDEKAPHMKNQWCLLGGSIEESGETPVKAVAREIMEEIGIGVDLQELKFFKKIVLRDGVHESYIFHALMDFDVEHISIGEGKEFRFFTKEKFLDMLKDLEYSNSFLKVLQEFVTFGKEKRRDIGPAI